MGACRPESTRECGQYASSNVALAGTNGPRNGTNTWRGPSSFKLAANLPRDVTELKPQIDPQLPLVRVCEVRDRPGLLLLDLPVARFDVGQNPREFAMPCCR